MAGFLIPFLGAAFSGLTTVVGGATSIAGGALAGAGGLASAGARMAGLTYNIGSDIVGAGAGLVKGVGKSVGVEPEPADQSTSDDQGAKALPPGVKLNKNGVMVQDKGAEGGGQVLPGQFDDGGNLMSLDDRLGSMEAPDRSDAGPVQQILDYVKVISANTARTAAGVGNMASSMQGMSAQGNIDDEKPPEQNQKQGVIGKMFSGVGKALKAVGSSLGRTAKFLIKGLAIGGLLYLFVNKREEIEESIAGLFKYFNELYIKLKDSDDPVGDIMTALKDRIGTMAKGVGDSIKTIFNDFKTESLSTLGPMTTDFFGWLLDTVKVFVNDTLGFNLFDTDKDYAIARTTKEMANTSGKISETLSTANLSMEDVGSVKYSPSSGQFGYLYDSAPETLEGKQGLQNTISTDAQNYLEQLYEISKRSGFRIQWKGLGWQMKGNAWWEGVGKSRGVIDIPIERLFSVQPILDNKVITREMLDNEGAGPGLDARAGVTKMSDPANSAKIMENLALIAEYTRIMEDTGKAGQTEGFFSGLGFGKDVTFETEIARMLKENAEVYLADADLYENIIKQQKLKTDSNTIGKYEAPSSLKSVLNSDTIGKLNSIGMTSSGPVLMDNSSHNNSVTKQGDTIQMPLDGRHDDPTQRLLTDMGGI